MATRAKKLQQHKTRFVAYVAASIDGRISLSHRKLTDWTSKEDWEFFQAELSKADAVVAGRNTYMAAKRSLDKRNTYVLTSRVKALKEVGKVKFINPKTTKLKDIFTPYKNVAIVGGAMVYQSMIAQGLLDELYVTIEPLIFGRGREMFLGGTKTAKARLLSTHILNKSGSLLLHYQIIYPKK